MGEVITDAVRAYFEGTAIRTAVDELVRDPRNAVPSDFDWSEVDGFLSACLAAQQVRIEYARALLGAWEETWSRPVRIAQLASATVPIAEHADFFGAIDVDGLWSTRFHYRYHRLKGRPEPWIGLGVGLSPSGVFTLAIEILDERKGRRLRPDLGDLGWERDEEDEDLWTRREEGEPDWSVESWEGRRAHASTALAAVLTRD